MAECLLDRVRQNCLGAVAVLTPMVSWLPWVSYLIDITGARSSAG